MEQELQKEQKCSFYALEQLRQMAEAILRGSQRLLKCRAGVEKYRTEQPQRAYAYYLELQKTRDALLAALGNAQRNLLELEESALAQKAGQLQTGLGRFDLMSRAYKPVYEVLTGFAKSLPQTDTVNAAVIEQIRRHALRELDTAQNVRDIFRVRRIVAHADMIHQPPDHRRVDGVRLRKRFRKTGHHFVDRFVRSGHEIKVS